MDLKAYAQIEDIGKIAEANGIVVPRLRGYRLMSEESAVTDERIADAIRRHEMTICERACVSWPRFRPDSNCSEYSDRTDRLRDKYLIRETVTEHDLDGREYSYEETIGFRWELLHGKNRKAVKFAIKKGRAAIRKNLETFNKYCGREDVLYIHARIGGLNWLTYRSEIENQPWFLEKVDDYYDDTYCDIYAKIAVED